MSCSSPAGRPRGPGRRPGTVITNVRVLTAEGLTGLTSVAIADGVIVEAVPAGAEVVDGSGGTLLPGLIDAHAHIDAHEQMTTCARWGVTTVLDMAARDWSTIRSLRHEPGLPDLAGDPTTDVRATRAIEGVWIAGRRIAVG